MNRRMAARGSPPNIQYATLCFCLGVLGIGLVELLHLEDCFISAPGPEAKRDEHLVERTLRVVHGTSCAITRNVNSLLILPCEIVGNAKNEGDFDTALELCARGGLKGRDERFAYLAAAIEGLRENHEEALELLEKAIEMNGVNRVHAFHDPDFQSLRDDPTSDEIFAVD